MRGKDGQSQACADAMGVHRNSLRYRLEWIAEVGEVDLLRMEGMQSLYLGVAVDAGGLTYINPPWHRHPGRDHPASYRELSRIGVISGCMAYPAVDRVILFNGSRLEAHNDLVERPCFRNGIYSKHVDSVVINV